MPIYLYKCKECGETDEAIRQMHVRDEPIICRCGGLAARTLHGQTPQGFWFAPPTHLRHRVDRTAHNMHERAEGRRHVQTNEP